MKVGVAKETAPGERRVALVPEALGKLQQAGLEILVEQGAGAGAAIPDSSYVDAVFVYHLNDHGSGDPNDKEDWFGLTRHDGSKKPAYRVVEQVTGG